NQPPTPPRALNVTNAAAIGASHATPVLAVTACIAWLIPCSPVTCSFGNPSSTLAVPAMYSSVMIAPAARIARGTVRLASWISSPIVDPLSGPPNANAIVDQKTTSFRLVLGTNAVALIGVADPKRRHETRPSTISSSAGIQLAIAPRLLSHLPTFSPTTL